MSNQIGCVTRRKKSLKSYHESEGANICCDRQRRIGKKRSNAETGKRLGPV